MDKLLDLLRNHFRSNLFQLNCEERATATVQLEVAVEDARQYLAEVTGQLKILDDKLQRSMQADINKNMAQRMQALELRVNLLNETFVNLGLSLQAAGQRRTALENGWGAMHVPDCQCPACNAGTKAVAPLGMPIITHAEDCQCNACRGGRKKVW